MTLNEALTAAETHAGRPLLADEIAMVAQLVERNAAAAELVTLFDSFERPPDIDDDDVPIHRYEPAADQAREI